MSKLSSSCRRKDNVEAWINTPGVYYANSPSRIRRVALGQKMYQVVYLDLHIATIRIAIKFKLNSVELYNGDCNGTNDAIML